jgi:hypothetical protein
MLAMVFLSMVIVLGRTRGNNKNISCKTPIYAPTAPVEHDPLDSE